MHVPKKLLTEARNTVAMFGVTFAAQIAMTGNGQVTKHVVVAALVAAGRIVFTSELPTLAKDAEPVIAAADKATGLDLSAAVRTIAGTVMDSHSSLSKSLGRIESTVGTFDSRAATKPASPPVASPAPVQTGVATDVATVVEAATQSTATAGFVDPPVVSPQQV